MQLTFINRNAIDSMVRKILGELECILPWWCDEICISYAYLPESSAMCYHSKEYRRLDITISSEEITDEDHLRKVLIHEVSHAYNEPLCAAEAEAKALIPEDLRDHFKSLFARRIEEQTSDLTIAFKEIIDGNNSRQPQPIPHDTF